MLVTRREDDRTGGVDRDNPATQQFAEKAKDVFGDAVFRNLDVLAVYED
ncbi:hypothetical protein [Dermatobacter hominis]|nr:hypothetical protein [Dermatobacter hominis]UDY35460.1 hypothetical protein LH044_19285 [Dermatobacter hominis]